MLKGEALELSELGKPYFWVGICRIALHGCDPAHTLLLVGPIELNGANLWVDIQMTMLHKCQENKRKCCCASSDSTSFSPQTVCVNFIHLILHILWQSGKGMEAVVFVKYEVSDCGSWRWVKIIYQKSVLFFYHSIHTTDFLADTSSGRNQRLLSISNKVHKLLYYYIFSCREMEGNA